MLGGNANQTREIAEELLLNIYWNLCFQSGVLSESRALGSRGYKYWYSMKNHS